MNKPIIDDGGPAFPLSTSSGSSPAINGMSLRDWFAGQALAGILSNQTLFVEVLKSTPSETPVNQAIASNALIIANAMIEARKHNLS